MSMSSSGGRIGRLEITIPAVEFSFDKPLLRRILRQAGQEIKATARALIGRDAGGRRYGGHTASAPGQPPGTLTGRLAASLTVRAKGDRVTISDVAAHSMAYYALFLEVGTVGGGRSKNLGRSHRRGASPGKPQTKRIMLPRPFLTTAAENELPSLSNRINAALKRGIDLKELKQR